jgi:hypothetical protein
LRFFRVCEAGGDRNAIGSTIPSVREYDEMLKVFEGLLDGLPEGVRESVMNRRGVFGSGGLDGGLGSSVDLADMALFD